MNGYLMSYHRYYHPLEFTTAYFNRADNDEDIAYGMKLLEYEGFTLENPKFRYSKGKYYFDRDNKIIYKGVGSIKGLSLKDGDLLYSLKDNNYNDFIELYKDIKEKCSIDTGKMEVLIKIGFFSEFGKTERLLKLMKMYNDISDRKTFKKDLSKYEEYGLTIDIVRRNSLKETEKTFSGIDVISIIKELSENIEDVDLPIKELLKAEQSAFGYITIKEEKLKNYLYVTKVDAYKNKKSTTYYLNAYDIGEGKACRVKIEDFEGYKLNPIKEDSIVQVNSSKIKPKKVQINEIDSTGNLVLDKNGKPKVKWVNSKEEYWKVIEEWLVIG